MYKCEPWGIVKSRWTLVISDETGRFVRTHSAQGGLKKGNLSKFANQAVRKEVLRQAVAEIQSQNADILIDRPRGGDEDWNDVLRASIAQEMQVIDGTPVKLKRETLTIYGIAVHFGRCECTRSLKRRRNFGL